MSVAEIKDFAEALARRYGWASERLYLEAALAAVEDAAEREDAADYLFQMFFFGGVEDVRRARHHDSADVCTALAGRLAAADWRLSLGAAIEEAEDGAIQDALRFVAAAAVAALASSDDGDAFDEE